MDEIDVERIARLGKVGFAFDLYVIVGLYLDVRART